LTLAPPSPGPLYSQRAETVRRTLTETGLDALIVTHPPNLRYLTGFDGSVGALLLAPTRAVLIVDGRYITTTRDRVASSGELEWIQVELATRSLEEGLIDAIAEFPAPATGVEAAAMTLSRFERLNGLLGARPGTDLKAGVRLIPTERIVERARVIKDAFEIGTLRKGAVMLSEVAGRVLDAVSPGRSEFDIAGDVDTFLRQAGFSGPAFDTIVASGPNSALPHARPGPRRLAPGDSVVLDFGGVYDGYCVDLTRTVQLPPATDAFSGTFAAVRAAHAAAIAVIRPGVKASLVDAAARDVLAARGLGDAFVHGTGHGLGLEVHEEPRITRPGSPALDDVLQPGMVFTVEPGAYLPGAHGVRIEDDVVVTAGGCEVLTSVPIDPIRTRPSTMLGATLSEVEGRESGSPGGAAGRRGPAGE
jgi:Xaa-Pro aminopeptidase